MIGEYGTVQALRQGRNTAQHTMTMAKNTYGAMSSRVSLSILVYALVLSITITAITMIAIASPNIDRARVSASILPIVFVPQILVVFVYVSVFRILEMVGSPLHSVYKYGTYGALLRGFCLAL